jgi:hypothetical protein
MKNTAVGNIIRELAVSVASVDYTDESGNGFFIRSTGAGNICYVPINNQDSEAVTKTVDSQVYFADPVLCKKIKKDGTTATGIYVGYGI